MAPLIVAKHYSNANSSQTYFQVFILAKMIFGFALFWQNYFWRCIIPMPIPAKQGIAVAWLHVIVRWQVSTQKIAENNVKAFCWKKDAMPRWETLILTKCDECFFVCPNKDLKNHTKTLHRNCREDCVKAFYWEGAFQSTGVGGTTFIPRGTIYCIVLIQLRCIVLFREAQDNLKMHCTIHGL